MHPERRLGVGGRPAVLEAAALVDGDVDQHAPRPHPADQLVADHGRGLGPGHQHRADHQVGVQHRSLHLERVGGDGLQVALVDPVGLAELVDVAVQQQHLGLHAEGDRGRVHPGDPGPDDHDLGRVDAGDAAHQGAAAAALGHQVVRADLRREPPRDLAHRGEQRQRAAGQLHRLVRDGGDLPVEQGLGALRAGGQVQVGEQDLAGLHPLVLDRDGFLDLEDHLGLAPHLVVVVGDLGPRGDELVVGDRGAGARSGLDDHLVAMSGELVHAGRGDRHPVLVVLDLAGDAHLHEADHTRR